MENGIFVPLHAAYEKLYLIQFVTYIHPLQMMIKTLGAQMGSKTLTRVPPDEIASADSLKNCFPVTLAALASQNQCQVSIVVRNKTKHDKSNSFQAICKIHVSGPVSMHS